MGEYAPPADTTDVTPPAACATTGDVTSRATATVPTAYGHELGADVCLDVDLDDPSVEVESSASTT